LAPSAPQVASLKETWRFRLRMDKKSEMRPLARLKQEPARFYFGLIWPPGTKIAQVERRERSCATGGAFCAILIRAAKAAV